ncbi:MAG: hypothetical protein K2W84_03525 [Burkholderiales bacterium]|nr:hypothetical protein [Burkholderiales bacterium]
MNDSQPPSPPISPRQRMQELLAIPDRNRTDAEWDELNELEIALASGNRSGAPDPNQQRRGIGVMPGPGGGQQKMGNNRPQNQNKNQGGGKKFHKRPGKRRGGGGGNGGNGGNGGGQPPQ